MNRAREGFNRFFSDILPWRFMNSESLVSHLFDVAPVNRNNVPVLWERGRSKRLPVPSFFMLGNVVMPDSGDRGCCLRMLNVAESGSHVDFFIKNITGEWK